MSLISEVLSLEVTLRNPLSVTLTIDNVFPLWTFIPQSQDGVEPTPISNETENNVTFSLAFSFFVFSFC